MANNNARRLLIEAEIAVRDQTKLVQFLERNENDIPVADRNDFIACKKEANNLLPLLQRIRDHRWQAYEISMKSQTNTGAVKK
mmetsp:Transcript_36589/g.45715  ORF Transcript_36589/g.45715 Transcript_36589/m.45715 type:complete len:83 (+) Transcript_36589:260-508(+)|eukprot:CAMPEP_0204833402 /NCGR_PEP_ID=MMETSP1346-20131115/16710_1 /ASSEMBLY_ACC=CAM_ASM_000771 /TAXON_ID=215587 /ORGANISM="Aplanochytrium stocchinoi, Strain GSBS06" /LENGTH=82 /DNA_ID=CAMNT_0051965907 /DNA_START=166 /DNA_END=414 /DNA_ORIENTATION=+